MEVEPCSAQRGQGVKKSVVQKALKQATSKDTTETKCDKWSEGQTRRESLVEHEQGLNKR